MTRLAISVAAALLVLQAGCVMATPDLYTNTSGLTSDDATVRRQTIQALVINGRTEAAAEIAFLVDPRFEEDARVRAAAASAMRSLRYAASAPLLVKGLGDADQLVRLQCAQSLVDLGTTREAPALVKVASDTGASSALRVEAVRALDRIGDPRTTPALIALVEDHDSGVRFAVRRALTNMAGKDLGPAASSWERWWHKKVEPND